jgi:hypothetical protein
MDYQKPICKTSQVNKRQDSPASSVKIITIIPVKVLTNTEYNSCRFESCPATNSILIKQLTTMLEIKKSKDQNHGM